MQAMVAEGLEPLLARTLVPSWVMGWVHGLAHGLALALEGLEDRIRLLWSRRPHHRHLREKGKAMLLFEGLELGLASATECLNLCFQEARIQQMLPP